MQNDFSTRLKYFRSLRDLSQVELAKRVGISSKQVSDYEVGSSKPRQSTYMKILNALEISDQVFSNSDLCSLDLNDLEDDQQVIFRNDSGDKIILSREFCTKNRFHPIKDLSVYKIQGNAMEETLLDGDLVLVDTTFRDIISGRLFLIYFYGEKMAVRLYRSQDGLINIVRDNKSYSDQESINESEIIVLGKIVYRQGLI
jgi:transcriptional regulator with XRE-family HTH domain